MFNQAFAFLFLAVVCVGVVCFFLCLTCFLVTVLGLWTDSRQERKRRQYEEQQQRRREDAEYEQLWRDNQAEWERQTEAVERKVQAFWAGRQVAEDGVYP